MSESTQYEVDVSEAYHRYSQDLWLIGRGDQGEPIFPKDDDQVAKAIRIASGRCGAACGAAAKRARRLLVFHHLERLKRLGVDLTFHTVQNFALRLLGRKFQGKAVLDAFATPGRSAANRTATNEETLAEAEIELRDKLVEQNEELAKVKANAKEQWASSSMRKKILKDWRSQRSADFKHGI